MLPCFYVSLPSFVASFSLTFASSAIKLVSKDLRTLLSVPEASPSLLFPAAMQKLRRLEDDRAELAKKLQEECGIVLMENSDASSLVRAINDLRTAELERKDAEVSPP